MSRGGGAHRAALSWLADKELLTSRPSPSKKYGRIYTPTERLARFAMGYNRWHLDLIEECYGALPGHEPLSAEEMRIRALTSFAGACGLNGARRASMAEMTAASGNHELSVTHQALTGWSAHKRIAASVRTLRDRRIKDYVPLFGAPIHGVRQTTNPRHIPRQSSAPSSERLSSSDVPR